MPRQSHATKALQLFTEILGDIETAFMNVAEMILPENLAAGLAFAGAQLRGIATTVGEGLYTAFQQGQAKLAAFFLMEEAQLYPLASFAMYEVQEHTDWPDWVAADRSEAQGAADIAEPLEGLELMGVNPAEMVAEALF